MLLILLLMQTAPPVQKHDSMTHYIILALASMQKMTIDHGGQQVFFKGFLNEAVNVYMNRSSLAKNPVKNNASAK